jgi:GAF domain-containing protein
VKEEFLSMAARALGRVAQGAAEAELDADLCALAASAAAAGSGSAFADFRQTVETVARTLRDNATAEKGLSLLIDTTHDLSGRLELPDLFGTIVARARILVGANLAWVTVLDEDSGMFRTVTAEGYLSPSLAGMRAHIDYGAVSLIMKSKSYFSTQDYLGDTRFRHMPELDRIFQTENIISLAGFPMLAGGEVNGFLFVADRYSRRLSGREMSILGSFALHAAVATRNANAFRQLSEALDEAQRSRKALIDHIQRVETSAALHDEMTSLLASGAELSHFLRRMVDRLDGAIFLYDEDLRVREEFRSPAYRGRLAQELAMGGIGASHLVAAISQSRHSGRSVIMLHTADEVCRVITLHGGSGRGESLVICHQGELDAMEVRNLERNAAALAIAKLWHEKRETEKVIASSTLLRHLVLVTPPDPATLSAVRERLNLASEEPVQMALVSIAGLDRAGQTAAVRGAANGINLLVDLMEDTYLAVGTERNIRSFTEALARRSAGWSVGGLISDPNADVASLSAQFGRMSRAMKVLREMKGLDRFVAHSQVSLFARLFEGGDAARLARYLEDMLQPVREKAPRQYPQLTQTLLCLFDSQHNITRVGEILGVHVNTVRQRLDTLREITGGWDDPIRALEFHLALRLDAVLRQGSHLSSPPSGLARPDR